MTLRVYNTLTRTKENFQTVVSGQVGMYLCGPTVYKPTHIGHMVGPVLFDTIKRYLTYCGYKVTLIINITDVDDKLINRARENGMPVDELARQMTQDYFDNLETMGADGVDHFPYATQHIDEMQTMIATLIEKGHAYLLNGDVYYDVSRDNDYGKLSRMNVEELMTGTHVQASESKRNPADFALWKKSKPSEPAWDSPWGSGRPGWHIECSAMSMKYLGESFDIHGGGLDLLFPHHENEMAQSESCTGKPFARYWFHNGLMQESHSAGKVGGAHNRLGDLVDQKSQELNKLAGSKGAAPVKELFELYHPETIRFFLLATHYRSPIEFSEHLIAETQTGLESFYRLIETFERLSGMNFYDLSTADRRETPVSLTGEPQAFFSKLTQLHNRFLEMMDDDFNTGGAIGTLFEMRKCINSFISDKKLDAKRNDGAQIDNVLATAMTLLKELANLLGVFRVRLRKTGNTDDKFSGQLMDLMIELRTQARQNKNFEMADRIRDGLTHLNVSVEDRPDGTIWRRE